MTVCRMTVSIIMKSFKIKPARRKADIAERLRPQRNKYTGGISEYSVFRGTVVNGGRVELVTLKLVILSSKFIPTSNGSSSVWLKSITLKTAQAPMSDVVIRKIANRIEGTDDIICPGPLFPGCDDPDIS